MAWRKHLGVAAAALGVWLLVRVPALQAAAPRRLAVASEHPLATRAAVAELRAGGNAVDAAIAATLVAGVVNPVSSGIGGGGFALYWDAKAQHATVLDFREVAPRALDAAAFEKRPFAQAERGRAVGVPGEVAGLWELHRRFGARQWAELVEPAILAAKDGFVPSPHLSRAVLGQMAALKQDTKLAELFFPGAAAGPGTRLKNPMLAHVLGWLRQLGPHAIYDGPVAGDIIASAGRAGGAIAYADLQGYRVVEREPLRISWEGNDVYTMPPPSAGGLMLGQVLGMFTGSELRSWGIDSGAYIHHLAEALRGSLVDRFTTLSDPAFEPQNVAALLAPQRLSRRRAAIDANKTRTLPQLLAEEHGTHHLVVVDSAGNVVSLTTTVNSPFGAKLATRSGFLLNDELDDFSRVSDALQFGLARSPNRPRPLARPVSSMTPTIVVRDGNAVLALGGSGGMRIAPNVTQALLARMVFGSSPQRSVERQRFALSLAGPSLLVDGASQALRTDLQARGETLGPLGYDFSAVQLVALEQGRYLAAADTRKSGLALAE